MTGSLKSVNFLNMLIVVFRIEFPCFGSLETSPHGFKARLDFALFAFAEAIAMLIA